MFLSDFSDWIFCHDGPLKLCQMSIPNFKIFGRRVSDFSIGRPCGAWCRGLTTCLTCVGHFWYSLNTRWHVRFTWRRKWYLLRLSDFDWLVVSWNMLLRFSVYKFQTKFLSHYLNQFSFTIKMVHRHLFRGNIHVNTHILEYSSKFYPQMNGGCTSWLMVSIRFRVVFDWILKILSIQIGIALKWMPGDLFDGKPTLVHGIA